jgi:hypothetical protein
MKENYEAEIKRVKGSYEGMRAQMIEKFEEEMKTVSTDLHEIKRDNERL